jgi:hypothetical protein
MHAANSQGKGIGWLEVISQIATVGASLRAHRHYREVGAQATTRPTCVFDHGVNDLNE